MGMTVPKRRGMSETPQHPHAADLWQFCMSVSGSVIFLGCRFNLWVRENYIVMRFLFYVICEQPRFRVCMLFLSARRYASAGILAVSVCHKSFYRNR